MPETWHWRQQYKGKSYTRSVGEGSIVRAKNGWLVAALRTHLEPQFFGITENDNFCGIGTSVSKDDGKAWSPVQVLYHAGRMHSHLLRMPNGDIVMTYIVRQDREDGGLAAYRRGSEALVSHDNGLTWDMQRKYILDGWDYSDGDPQTPAVCGHLGSTLLDDGSILTAYGNYVAKGVCLIRWRPA